MIGSTLNRQTAVELVGLGVLGRRFATLAAGPHAVGRQRAVWDVRTFALGTYLVRLRT